MNDSHSGLKSGYKKRWVTPQIVSSLKSHPVAVLTGARQVGKSMLLNNEKPFLNWGYVTLDDFDILEQVESEHLSLWKSSVKIILDEVQKVPKLLSSIKRTVDKERGKKRFVLSGSANLLLMHRVSETLAGRAIYFSLFPMILGEIYESAQTNILSQTYTYENIESLKVFLDEYPEAIMGILIYTGREVKFLGDKIMAIPWTFLPD